ncbi:hypothetical protein EDD18DRAFT_1334204 [Armillaria luteobubalina]|uniref:MFS general substrate transporter n=1 Tax=Armillaria luteobubalina TaxID=153913 RepID=A0AA39UTQ7_9AGAR|nr:hypothetical protein EDD18DRAFT_1334204 [Armillaria luteobubalina]
MASGLLQLRGIGGLEGWKWLFLIDGIITTAVAVATWFYLPNNITQTGGGLRGWKPWFDERQLQIGVTRVIQDDISKHLPTVIKSFHFDVFVANALTAPPYVLQCIMMVSFIWHSDRVRERGLHGAFGGWILLRALPSGTSRGVKSVGKRTIASGCVIFAANIYGGASSPPKEMQHLQRVSIVWGSQIYQSDDAPGEHPGLLLMKYYYRYRNARNARLYAELNEQEKAEESNTAEERGNRGLTFRFTT